MKRISKVFILVALFVASALIHAPHAMAVTTPSSLAQQVEEIGHSIIDGSLRGEAAQMELANIEQALATLPTDQAQAIGITLADLQLFLNVAGEKSGAEGMGNVLREKAMQNYINLENLKN